MAHDQPVRPETHALETLIRGALSGKDDRSDPLLFLGNSRDVFPDRVVRDPVLEPVDKVVWLVIRQCGLEAGPRALFPSYEEIGRRANVGSTSTVSRALAILRTTRWLSCCDRQCERNGRLRGSAYALHDEPLPLADALYLDLGYRAFLEAAKTHHHAQVRRVAASVLASLEEYLVSHKVPSASAHPIERRVGMSCVPTLGKNPDELRFDATVLGGLANPRDGVGAIDRHQNSKPGPEGLRILRVQNSKAGSSSNEYIKPTTTTEEAEKENSATPLARALRYPRRLNANQRALADRYLARIPADTHQAVLDELDGRLQAEKRGAKPVYDPLRYLHRLCQRVERGAFHPNHGLALTAEQSRRRAETSSRQPEPQRNDAVSRAAAKRALAEIRKTLATPTPSEKTPAPNRRNK